MKQFKTALLTVGLMFIAIGMNAQTKEVKIKTKTYCDHFAECETGKTRLEKELAYTKGIKKIDIDGKSMIITVQYNSKKTNEQKIREAVSKAGYDADDIPADPKGCAKLDDCCKKK